MKALDVLRAIRDLDVKVTDKALLTAIVLRCDRKSWSTFAGIDTLAYDAGLQRRATINGLRRLTWAIHRPTNPGGAHRSTVTTLDVQAIVARALATERPGLTEKGARRARKTVQNVHPSPTRVHIVPAKGASDAPDLPRELPTPDTPYVPPSRGIVPPIPQVARLVPTVMQTLDDAEETHRDALDLDEVRSGAAETWAEAAEQGFADQLGCDRGGWIADAVEAAEEDHADRRPWRLAATDPEQLVPTLARALGITRKSGQAHIVAALVYAANQRAPP